MAAGHIGTTWRTDARSAWRQRADQWPLSPLPAPFPLFVGPGPGPALPVSGVMPELPVAWLCVLVPELVTPAFGVESVGSPAPGPLVAGSGPVPVVLGSFAGGEEPPQATDRMVAVSTRANE